MVRTEVGGRGLAARRAIEDPAQRHSVHDATMEAETHNAPVQWSITTSTQYVWRTADSQRTDPHSAACPSHDRRRSATMAPRTPVSARTEPLEFVAPHPCRWKYRRPTRSAARSEDTPQLEVRCFMSTTAAMTSGVGPLGPGFVGALDEKSRRYLRCVSARWRRNSVDGLKTIAE